MTADVPLGAPDRLARAVAEAGDPGGAVWLDGLAERAGGLLERWRLTPVRVVRPGGTRGLVVLVRTAEGTAAALKVSRDAAAEGAALACWDGLGAVRVLRADPEAGALLLERLRGEVSLRSLPEAKADLEAAGLLRRLWVPPAAGHGFVSVAERTGAGAAALRAAAGEPWAADAGTVPERAADERDRLVAEPGDAAPVLLHGAFRHGAVLAAERVPWLAVGPRPLVGDRAYDLAWPARDRLSTLAGSPAAPKIAVRRVARLAEALEVDRERLRGWAVFRAAEAGVRALAAGRRAEGELLLEFASWL